MSTSSRSRSPRSSRSSTPRSRRSFSSSSSRSSSPPTPREVSPVPNDDDSRARSVSPTNDKPQQEIKPESPKKQKNEKEPGSPLSALKSPVTDAPDDSDLLLQFTLNNDAVHVDSLLDGQSSNPEAVAHLLTAHHAMPEGGADSGNIVYIAAHSGKKDVLAVLAKHQIFHDQLAKPVVVRMLTFQRYAIVLHIVTLAPELLTATLDANGNTLLHLACMRRRPAASFAQKLLVNHGADLDVNATNAEGQTALHLVALRSSGIEGRDLAKLLLKFGCDEDIQDNSGTTATTAAINPFVRQVLGITGNVKPRPVPQIDDDSKAEIDACADSSKFPEIKDIDPELIAPADRTSEEESILHMNASKKQKKRLTGEEMDGMVHRLYDQSIASKERWVNTQMSRISDQDKSMSKQLNAEDVDAAVYRLYDEQLERTESTKEALTEKYIYDLNTRHPELDSSELEDMGNRLCRGSLEHKAKVREKLKEQFAPEPVSRKLTKDGVASLGTRLHDESTSKTKEKYNGLYDKYTNVERGRFGGKSKLSKSQMKDMGDRLCTPKQRM